VNSLSGVAFRCALLFLGPAVIVWGGVSLAEDGDVSFGAVRGVAWLVTIFAFVAILSGLGSQAAKDSLGLLVDRRNRYSLSRFQIVLWTTLVLPSLYVTFVSNIIWAWGDGTAATSVNIDWTLVSLMGISVASFVASPMALSVKSNQEPDQAEAERALMRPDNGADQIEGKLIKRADNAPPKISDLFLGEEVGNAGALDIPRLQMLGLTVIVWVAYGLELASIAIFRNVQTVTDFPTFSGTLLTLVMVSHGGYITGKLIPNSQKPKENVAADLARLNGITMRVDALLAKAGNASRADDDPAVKAPFERIKLQLNAVLSDAQNLNTQAGEGTLDTMALSRLEGRLDGVAASFETAEAARSRILADVPAADLVAAVRSGLVKAGLTPDSVPGTWTAKDEAAAGQFLRRNNINDGELSNDLVSRLEELEDLTA